MIEVYNVREAFLTIMVYLAPLFLFCGAYAFVISPLMYYKWIIPKIEKRYGKKLKFDPIHRFDTTPMTYLDLASYITHAFFSHRLKWRYYDTINKFNYDVKTAPKVEIIVSISTTIAWYVLCFFVLSRFILVIYDWIINMKILK